MSAVAVTLFFPALSAGPGPKRRRKERFSHSKPPQSTFDPPCQKGEDFQAWGTIASAQISTRAPPSSIKAAARVGIPNDLLLQASETSRSVDGSAGTDRRAVLLPSHPKIS